MQHDAYWDKTSLREVIEQAREEEGFGLRELARASGVSAGQISRILAGKTSRPSVETLVRLAGALERDVDALLVLAESPEAFSGARLDAARIRLLEAIAQLPADHRQALATEERDLRLQLDEAARLENDIQRLEARLVESRAASTAPLADLEESEETLGAPHASFASDDEYFEDRAVATPTERSTTVAGESERLENELHSLQAERKALDETFAAAVRAAAARLFTHVRGRESTQTSASAPAWHTQPRTPRHETVVPRFSTRPLSELLPDARNIPRATVERQHRQERTTERELRHLLRVWEQLSPARRQRVAEFIDDQHRLSLHEQLSQDTKEEPREEQ